MRKKQKREPNKGPFVLPSDLQMNNIFTTTVSLAGCSEMAVDQWDGSAGTTSLLNQITWRRGSLINADNLFFRPLCGNCRPIAPIPQVDSHFRAATVASGLTVVFLVVQAHWCISIPIFLWIPSCLKTVKESN